jgi:hypothetical protein
VKFAGNGSAGHPGTAATPNLLCPCFHHSFLASFAVAFIARLSNAKGKVGSFELISGRVAKQGAGPYPLKRGGVGLRSGCKGPLDACEPPRLRLNKMKKRYFYFAIAILILVGVLVKSQEKSKTKVAQGVPQLRHRIRAE